MSERKIILSWKELEKTLQEKELAFREEEIREITLVKPRQMIIYLRK